MKKFFLLVVSALTLLGCSPGDGGQKSSGFDKLDEWTARWKEGQQTYFGYPANRHISL